MSRETGALVTHFPAGLGWSPRLTNAVTACGELVAQIRTSRKAWEVDCLRCRSTRIFRAAFEKQRRETLRRARP